MTRSNPAEAGTEVESPTPDIAGADIAASTLAELADSVAEIADSVAEVAARVAVHMNPVDDVDADVMFAALLADDGGAT